MRKILSPSSLLFVGVKCKTGAFPLTIKLVDTHLEFMQRSASGWTKCWQKTKIFTAEQNIYQLPLPVKLSGTGFSITYSCEIPPSSLSVIEIKPQHQFRSLLWAKKMNMSVHNIKLLQGPELSSYNENLTQEQTSHLKNVWKTWFEYFPAWTYSSSSSSSEYSCSHVRGICLHRASTSNSDPVAMTKHQL